MRPSTISSSNNTATLLFETTSSIDLSNEQNGTDCGSRRCNAVPLAGSASVPHDRAQNPSNPTRNASLPQTHLKECAVDQRRSHEIYD
jgi:hypothetical protein